MRQSPALRLVAVCLAGLLTSSLAVAQSSSFAQVKGKNCPGGFSGSKGMCTSEKGDKIGMVKTGSCPKEFSDTGAYCYKSVK